MVSSSFHLAGRLDTIFQQLGLSTAARQFTLCGQWLCLFVRCPAWLPTPCRRPQRSRHSWNGIAASHALIVTRRMCWSATASARRLATTFAPSASEAVRSLFVAADVTTTRGRCFCRNGSRNCAYCVTRAYRTSERIAKQFPELARAQRGESPQVSVVGKKMRRLLAIERKGKHKSAE